MQQRRPAIGVAVIIQDRGRVLLGQRRASHGTGTWQFPGGHLEFSEAIDTCARREVREETGLEVGTLHRGPYTNDIFVADQRHYITLFVFAEYLGGTPDVREPEKCARWDWFRCDALPQPLFLPIANLLRQHITLC